MVDVVTQLNVSHSGEDPRSRIHRSGGEKTDVLRVRRAAQGMKHAVIGKYLGMDDEGLIVNSIKLRMLSIGSTR